MAKTIKYEPKVIECIIKHESKPNPFANCQFTIEMPFYSERRSLLREMAEKETAEKKTEYLFTLVDKHVKGFSAELNGEKFESLDELGLYKEGSELINHIGQVILSGIPLGEASPPQS